MAESATMTVAEIEDLAFRALVAHGASETAALSLARAVAAAECEGIASHGLVYLPTYCEHLDCGKVDRNALPRLAQGGPAALSVDACHGFAHPAIDVGFEKLVPLAREQGIAAVSVHNSYNCAVLGYHVGRLACEGLLGLGFTNAPASIAPSGGKRPVVGTNPFAFAVPGPDGRPSILVDQSASVIAKSEVAMRARAGEPVPEGWVLDAEGRPTTDAAAGLKGSMVPSGGYKGFGIGLLVEVLAAAVSGANLGIHASPFSGPAGGPPGTGQLFIAISPARFSGDRFAERIECLVSAVTAQEGARLPGMRRSARATKATTDGIAVPIVVLRRVQELIGA